MKPNNAVFLESYFTFYISISLIVKATHQFYGYLLCKLHDKSRNNEPYRFGIWIGYILLYCSYYYFLFPLTFIYVPEKKLVGVMRTGDSHLDWLWNLIYNIWFSCHDNELINPTLIKHNIKDRHIENYNTTNLGTTVLNMTMANGTEIQLIVADNPPMKQLIQDLLDEIFTTTKETKILAATWMPNTQNGAQE